MVSVAMMSTISMGLVDFGADAVRAVLGLH